MLRDCLLTALQYVGYVKLVRKEYACPAVGMAATDSECPEGHWVLIKSIITVCPGWHNHVRPRTLVTAPRLYWRVTHWVWCKFSLLHLACLPVVAAGLSLFSDCWLVLLLSWTHGAAHGLALSSACIRLSCIPSPL